MKHSINNLHDYHPGLSRKRHDGLYLPFSQPLALLLPRSNALDTTCCKREKQEYDNQCLHDMFQTIIERLDSLSETVEALKTNASSRPLPEKQIPLFPAANEPSELNKTLYGLQESIGSLSHELQKMYASRSWRYTFLCRKIAHFYRQQIKPPLKYLYRKMCCYLHLDKLVKMFPQAESSLSSGFHDLSSRGAKIYAALLSHSTKRKG